MVCTTLGSGGSGYNQTHYVFKRGAAIVSDSKLKVLGRGIKYLLLLAVVLAGGAFCGSIWRREVAMPNWMGRCGGGARAPVTVVRDEHGVPSITAQTMDDLFFAQGYVTAQDRLWQMDMMRRFAAGELAAALGSDFVKADREQRTLGLREVARRSLEQARRRSGRNWRPMRAESMRISPSISMGCRWRCGCCAIFRERGRRRIRCW